MTNSVPKWTEFAFAGGLRVLGILLVAILLNRLLRVVTKRLVRLASSRTRVAQMREEQTRTMAGLLYSAGTAVVVTAAVLTALPEFGVNITPIAALGGLATVAIGFGAQNVVRDLINGFFIVFEDQYVVGDTIRVGETVGRVEHLTLRRTVLRDLQGALVTLANGDLRQVANLSRDWSQLFVDVQVPGETPVDAALAALEKASGELRADASWSAALVDGPRVLGVESLALAGTTLRVQVRTAPTRQYDVARELRRRVLSEFERQGIALSNVQRVELVGSAQVSEPVADHVSKE